MIGDDSLRETYVEGQQIYDGAIIKVEKWRVSLPDGRFATREVVLHNGAAAVVPVDAEGYVTLVRQHRVALNLFTWEVPAGKLDFVGEDPLSCAKRELEEETGLRAKRWQQLNHVVTTPGFCTERIALYLARDLSQHETHRDKDEFLQLMRLPLSQAVDMVMAGELVDAKTCLALLMAERVIAAERQMYQKENPAYKADAAPRPGAPA